MRSLAFHLLRDDADADDAAQETLARALATTRRPDETLPWLAGVLRNVVRRGSRDRVRRAAREARVARAEALPATADFVAREQILRRVADAVLALEEPQRVVVLLRHYEGLPPREIAARLGAPVETVKSRLKRAHERLRETLDEGPRGNVEGWRSALGGLVGLAPDGAPIPGGIAGDLASTGTGRAAGAAAKGGTVMASKTVVVAAVAAFVLGLGGVLVWKAPWRADDDRNSPTAASHESVGGVADDHAPALAAPPQPVGGMGLAQDVRPDAPAPDAPTNPPTGPAAGWKRWTLGSIQLDVPETWVSTDDSHPPDRRGWSTGERPVPDATFYVSRSGAGSYERLLADSQVVLSEDLQIAGSKALVRVIDSSASPPGKQLRALILTVDEPSGESRPLSCLAISAKDRFAEFEPTYRAIVASIRVIASASPTGNELPSNATLRAYEGETPADVLEGVVLLGDTPFPGGEARLTAGTGMTTAVIGTDGRFRFDGLGTTAISRLVVEPLATAPREIFLTPTATPASTRRRVILVLGWSAVEGHVFDRDGRPVAGAAVRVAWNGRRAAASYADDVAVTTTGRDGAYRANRLLPGRYTIHATFEKNEPRESLVEVSGTTPVVFDLGSPRPEPTLSGAIHRVGGAVSGPGSLMFMSNAPGATSMVIASYDAEGRYSTRIPVGTYLVRVQPPFPAPSILLDATVKVASGTSTQDLTLPEGRVRGRVVDPATHRAVERAKSGDKPWKIQLMRIAAGARNIVQSGEIAEDGTFQFEFIPPGTYAVMCTAPLAPGPDGKPRVIEVVGGGATTNVELELQAK